MTNRILTAREKEVISKRINHKRLNQLDSNILTKSVRPKLKEILNMDAKYLLERLSYNPSSRIIEEKIKKLILENIKNTISIIIYGSAIQTSYSSYNDIDVLIITKNRIWKNQLDKHKVIKDLKQKAKKINLLLDIEILSEDALSSYPYNPTLIYQIKDHKKIYGNIDIPDNINLSKLDIRMKLDWSEGLDMDSDPDEIYSAIRNAILVRLLTERIIDNQKLNHELIERLGKELISKLKNDDVSKIEKRYALNYLNEFVKKIKREVIAAKWERIEL